MDSHRHASRPLLALLALALAAAGCSGASPSSTATPECTSAAACDDGNPCTADACTGGRCTHLPEPPDALCSANGGQVCDGAGSCVACNRDAQCAGTSPATECQHPGCTAGHACAPTLVDAGTVTSTQVAGDCHRTECDGAGATRSVVDDADAPVDGSECTLDLCTAGVASNPPRTAGTPCGAGGAFQCNATGHCGCLGDGDCTGPATCGGGGTPGICGCTPLTCAGAGATCGAPSNGCGGTLSCDDGVKDGGETAVDCGGAAATCATRCAQGKACLAGSDCATGSCVDGVCCDTACAGACQACSAAKKGQGADGVCGAIAAGTDPDAECADQGAASCGSNGVCDGAGACQRYTTGTQCAPPSCSGGAASGASTCDGAGTCVPGASSSCGTYACGPTSCKATCASAADCAATAYCALTGQCAAKKAQGTACDSATECTTGSCADGVCCDTACAGACQACSAAKKGQGADGVCGAIATGTDPDAECPGSGTPCGSPGCDGAGACQPPPSYGSTCAPPSCSGGIATGPSTCIGLTCVSPPPVDCIAAGRICSSGVCL